MRLFFQKINYNRLLILQKQNVYNTLSFLFKNVLWKNATQLGNIVASEVIMHARAESQDTVNVHGLKYQGR